MTKYVRFVAPLAIVLGGCAAEERESEPSVEGVASVASEAEPPRVDDGSLEPSARPFSLCMDVPGTRSFVCCVDFSEVGGTQRCGWGTYP
jgi:hypothetical protein